MRYLLITYAAYKTNDVMTSVKASNAYPMLVQYAFEYTVKHTIYTPYFPPIQPMVFSNGEISCGCPEVLAHIYSKKWASVFDTECDEEEEFPTTPKCIYDGTQDPRLFSTCETSYLSGRL